MSWKGFTKAVTRLPHIVMAKAGYAEETIDDEFEKAELNFKELEASTKQLESDVKNYKTAVKNMITHQKSFGQALQILAEFDPTGPQSVQLETIIEYVQGSSAWSDELSPRLEEAIQMVVVAGTDNFMHVIKSVRSTIDKRNRKHIDYDRRLTALKKAQEVNDKAQGGKIQELAKAESAFDEARREYESINTRIKEEIPTLEALRISFMDPFLQTLIFFQIHLFESALANLENVMMRIDNSDPDINAVFKVAIEPSLTMLKELTLINPKLLDPSAESRDTRAAADEKYNPHTSNRFSRLPAGAQEADFNQPPPSYENGASPSSSSSSSQPLVSFDAKTPSATAASSPKNASSNVTKAIALFTYQSDTAGDLCFNKDDIIEIVQMTESTDDWWTGKKGNQQGFFPANYVQLL